MQFDYSIRFIINSIIRGALRKENRRNNNTCTSSMARTRRKKYKIFLESGEKESCKEAHTKTLHK